MCAQQVHDGHRQRLKKRFLNEGIESFNDHQVLELMLFYSRPRSDTNETAHLLLQRFGNLSAVFNADPRDLATTPGVGEHGAVLLSLIAPVCRRYMADVVQPRGEPLTSPAKAIAYVKPLMLGRIEEVFYVVCLDSQARVRFPALLSKGTVNEAFVSPRQVVSIALQHHACTVLLAHNHPSGDPTPSTADKHLTYALVHALESIGIQVFDHLIIAGENSFSFAEADLLHG